MVSIKISENIEQPFRWSTSPLRSKWLPFPGAVTEDGRGAIEALPEEILNLIFPDSVDSVLTALNLSYVSRQFHKLSESNEIWRPFFLARWPNQSKSLKFKNWRKFYQRRVEATLKSIKTCGEVHPIENCTFEFACPMVAEQLAGQLRESSEVHCETCKQNVYRVESQEEVRSHESTLNLISLLLFLCSASGCSRPWPLCGILSPAIFRTLGWDMRGCLGIARKG